MVDPTGVAPIRSGAAQRLRHRDVRAHRRTPRRVQGAGGHRSEIGGAVGVAKVISDAEQDTLNPIGVNVIRFFPRRDWSSGAPRTLATQSDPEYRYVPIRRFAIFLGRASTAASSGLSRAERRGPVGQPAPERRRLHDDPVPQRRVPGRHAGQGVLREVRRRDNPQDQINAGIVTCWSALPAAAAEFVVIRISQKTAEAAA